MNALAKDALAKLTERYETTLTAIEQARVSGAGPVRLLAVSKTHPAAAIRALHALGQRDFGENYAQELASKATELADLPGLRLIFIGRLQSNKLAAIVQSAAAVQSLASERHARLLAKHVAAAGKAPYPVHILVNAGDEATKDGVALAAVPALAAVIANLPELRLRGLMAIPPPLPAGVTQVPALYLELRRLATTIGDGDLSLGMTDDLALAIAAGSDCVRVGTAIFGSRPRPAV